MVLWIIGMSGSGKTVLGKYIYDKLKPVKKNLLFLDGDILRDIMGNDLGHTFADREKNAKRIDKLCKYLDSQGINVIFSLLSIFHSSQDWMRANVKDYFEVYLDTEFETLVERDSKGIYKKALKGEASNVVGVDIPFPAPKSPDMIIRNNASLKDLFSEGDRIVEAIKGMLS